MNAPRPDHGTAPDAGTAPEPAPRGAQLLRAVEVMDALAGEHGDAWTHRQTHLSLARYLLEETHEVLEVIEDPASHGPRALPDELGDLLFQILFHARVGQDEDPAWDVDDVARAFVAKMERRNPHVFGEHTEQALENREDVEQIIAQWHAVKAAEKPVGAAAEGGAAWFAGIPAQLPALQTAAKTVHRSRSADGLTELLAAADAVAEQTAAQEPDAGADIARALLDLVVAAEARDVDPEAALRTLLRRTRSQLAAHPGTDAADPRSRTP